MHHSLRLGEWCKFITDIILSEKLTVNNISKFYPFTLKSALLYHSRITMQNLIIKLRDAYGLPISQRNYRFGYFRKWLWRQKRQKRHANFLRGQNRSVFTNFNQQNNHFEHFRISMEQVWRNGAFWGYEINLILFHHVTQRKIRESSFACCGVTVYRRVR